ncbi:MAG: MoaD/ThiS family protein [Thermoplasmatota archaeon]
MQVNVRFRPRRQEDRAVEVPEGATAADVVQAVGEPLDVIVVVRAGVPIAEDSPVVDGEELLLLSAASGG